MRSESLAKDAKEYAIKQKQLSRRQQFELERMKINHLKQKNAINQDHKTQLDLKTIEHRKNLDQRQQQFDEMISTLNKDLEATQKAVEKQKKFLTQSLDEERRVRSLIQKQQLEDQAKEYEESLKELTQMKQLELERINRDFQAQKQMMKQEQKNQTNQLIEKHDTTLEIEKNEFETAQKLNEIQRSELKRAETKKFLQERVDADRKQKEILAKRKENFLMTKKQTETSFKNRLEDSKSFYENKYKETLKTQDQLLYKLEKHGKSLVREVHKDLLQKVSNLDFMKDDSFYNHTDLKYELRDKGDTYELSIDMPAPLARDLSLNVQKREGIIQFHRRFENENTSDQGEISKTSRFESVIKKISFDDIVEPNKLSKTYNDQTNQVVYTIAKA